MPPSLMDQPSNAIEESLPFVEDELLDDPEVSQLLGDIDSSVSFLKTSPKEEKVKNFLSTDHFLGKFYEEMEQQEEISDLEESAIEIIKNELIKKMDVVNTMVDTLIESQRQNLIRRGLPREPVDMVAVEINHITDVVKMTRSVFPTLPILHLAAAAHDSYKYNTGGKMELGLHELASTALGPLLVEKLLQKHKSELEIDDRHIALIKKIVQRAILTHGTDEFPEKNATYSTNNRIGELFGSVYPKITKRSWSLLKNNTSAAALTTAGLNYLDAVTGTSYTSFIKYNNITTYSNEYLARQDTTLTFFLTHKILGGFDSNISLESGRLIQAKIQSKELQNIITENTKVRDILLAVINGQRKKVTSEMRGQRGKVSQLFNEYNKLIASFSNLKNTVIQAKESDNQTTDLQERKQFDAQLISFITLTHILTTSLQK